MKNITEEWFYISNADSIDSPALLLYKERVKQNILRAKKIAGNVNTLRPHVKTSKIAEVVRMMMEEGIHKFKCATIAEAEMLGLSGASSVLVAYPLGGPKVDRFIRLIREYPATYFSCVADNENSVVYLNEKAVANKMVIEVYLDINTGMNRTGIHIDKASSLFEHIYQLEGISVKGLHAYDGHIHDTDIRVRQKRSDEEFEKIRMLVDELSARFNFIAEIVVGGSPTFPTHVNRKNVECSPGTFVFWDHGYKTSFAEQPFEYAVLVLTRVLSVVDEQTICIDLGYKSVSSEMPFPRVFFLNATDITEVSHSEEHLVLKVKDSSAYKPGDILYGIPVHICPTVALYERVAVIENNKAVDEWKVIARDRKINI
jgi:D-serine deaminase-like pyridoxal phosphate-dependent protein